MAPQRQRAAHNLIRNYIFNGYRRLAVQVPYWVVPFAIGEFEASLESFIHIHSPLHSEYWLGLLHARTNSSSQGMAPTPGRRAMTNGKTARRLTLQDTQATNLYLSGIPLATRFNIIDFCVDYSQDWRTPWSVIASLLLGNTVSS